ncbi:MAG TPA: hypothetical protein VFL91_28445 [Thermomicrobiales bacterium]|nr:hypothetical protein [Thermomicrobiales bacterium]
MSLTSQTVVKSVELPCSAAAAFAFLADGRNWPRFAIHNIFAIRPGDDGDWLIDTPRGPGRLRLRPDAASGILDHEFIDPREGRWDVPARVVPAGERAIFIMTLTRPTGMAERDFVTGLALLDDELATLQRLLAAPAEDRLGATAGG